AFTGSGTNSAVDLARSITASLQYELATLSKRMRTGTITRASSPMWTSIAPPPANSIFTLASCGKGSCFITISAVAGNSFSASREDMTLSGPASAAQALASNTTLNQRRLRPLRGEIHKDVKGRVSEMSVEVRDCRSRRVVIPKPLEKSGKALPIRKPKSTSIDQDRNPAYCLRRKRLVRNPVDINVLLSDKLRHPVETCRIARGELVIRYDFRIVPGEPNLHRIPRS